MIIIDKIDETRRRAMRSHSHDAYMEYRFRCITPKHTQKKQQKSDLVFS